MIEKANLQLHDPMLSMQLLHMYKCQYRQRKDIYWNMEFRIRALETIIGKFCWKNIDSTVVISDKIKSVTSFGNLR